MMTDQHTVTLRRESADAGLNRDVLAVCRDVVQVCAEIVGAVPPLGIKSYVVQQAPDGKPRACLNGFPSKYWINVTCLHTRLYAKLAFQLGHELGHFFIDPHYSNWFIESVCTSLSFLCLDCLAVRWITTLPFSNWRQYALAFAKYRKKTVDDACAKVGLSGSKEIPSWIRERLRAVVGAGRFSRPEEALCADVIAKMIHARQGTCSAITRLGRASQTHGMTDFSAWREEVTPEERRLVDDLRDAFAHAFWIREESNKEPEATR